MSPYGRNVVAMIWKRKELLEVEMEIGMLKDA